MVGAVFDGIGSDPQRQQGGIGCAENLGKRGVEITWPGLRFLLAVILLLRLDR